MGFCVVTLYYDVAYIFVVSSAMKAHQFFTEESWDSFKQIFDTYMFEASKVFFYDLYFCLDRGILVSNFYGNWESHVGAPLLFPKIYAFFFWREGGLRNCIPFS